eukprot:5805272-Prymnesium_polylepis.1
MRHRSDADVCSRVLAHLAHPDSASTNVAFARLGPQLIARLGARADDDDDGRSTLYSGATGGGAPERGGLPPASPVTPPDVGGMDATQRDEPGDGGGGEGGEGAGWQSGWQADAPVDFASALERVRGRRRQSVASSQHSSRLVVRSEEWRSGGVRSTA